MVESSGTGKHVLIVVQNLPVPLDRRVWLECRALVEAEESPPVLAEWAGNREEAIARGVFGSPTFFLPTPGGALWLWGQDRLFFLEQALAGDAVQTP